MITVVMPDNKTIECKTTREAARIVRKALPNATPEELVKHIYIRSPDPNDYDGPKSNDIVSRLEKNLKPEESVLMERYPGIRDVLCDPSSSRQEKVIRAEILVSEIRKEIHSKREEADRRESALEDIQDAKEMAYVDWNEWLKCKEFKLEKNECSRLHHFAEALDKYGALTSNGKLVERGDAFPDWSSVHVFVVQHDWGAAFKNATDYLPGDEWKSPFDYCVFELRITGHTVLMFATNDSETGLIQLMPWVKCGEMWMAPDGDAVTKTSLPFKLAADQVHAICVALDAEVATHDVVRAPTKLNKKREAQGKLPLFDYHVVKLERKSRPTTLAVSGATHRSPRLHFRRGHYRHYPNYKTWVRWTLVGDPDLGYIDKEYRL